MIKHTRRLLWRLVQQVDKPSTENNVGNVSKPTFVDIIDSDGNLMAWDVKGDSSSTLQAAPIPICCSPVQPDLTNVENVSAPHLRRDRQGWGPWMPHWDLGGLGHILF